MFDGSQIYFCLRQILPPGHWLTWQPDCNILIHFSSDTQAEPCIHGSQEVTDEESRILLPLLQAHPDCCPYEVMLAHLHSPGRVVTEELVGQTRQWLQETEGTAAWEQQLQPVRNILFLLRPKLQGLGFDIEVLPETGYALCRSVAIPDADAF